MCKGKCNTWSFWCVWEEEGVRQHRTLGSKWQIVGYEIPDQSLIFFACSKKSNHGGDMAVQARAQDLFISRISRLKSCTALIEDGKRKPIYKPSFILLQAQHTALLMSFPSLSRAVVLFLPFALPGLTASICTDQPAMGFYMLACTLHWMTRLNFLKMYFGWLALFIFLFFLFFF